MRRLFGLVAVLLVAGTAQPVFADDIGARQQDLKQQLAAAAAQITQLNDRMATLERSVADTQQRIVRERAQVRMLARALYAQPDSLVATVFESASLADAMTRIADLTSAGDRAMTAKRQLDQDMTQLSAQRAQLQSDHDRQTQLQQQLEDQYNKLAAQAAAQKKQLPLPPVIPPGGATAIQQIILDAFAPLGAGPQQWALRVAKCESQYNPYAVNRSSGAAGLFQFLPSTWASLPQHNQSVFDPTANAQAAAVLYQRSGPGQWVCQG
jgi:hypothetical protein